MLAAGSGPSPEEWREFRKRLVTQGLPLTTDEPQAESEEEAPSRTPVSVAPANEKLLRRQNAQLWEEYMSGVWAHSSPVEAGGLLCRLPLQAQLTEAMRQDARVGEKLGGMAEGGEGQDGLELADSDSLALRLRKMVLRELPAGYTHEVAQSWLANSAYCFRLADRLLAECFQGMSSRASGGRLDMRQLRGYEADLIRCYKAANDDWQQVVLVLKAKGGSAEGVALNRPLAMNTDRRLAQLLLRGHLSSVEADALTDDMLKAFGKEAAVYLGGPDGQQHGGLLVHGFENLEGATEVAPGTRIYTGGVEAAIASVLSGEHKPLDFRWFVGVHSEMSTDDFGWAPVACARSLALKQCIGLPKPLWHEVLELCGGDLAVWSQIELMKRTDLGEQ